MRTLSTVDGPRAAPFYQGRAGRTITDDNARELWKKNDDIGGRKGRYVFGMRAGGGFTPAYVGKATKSFKQEVFTHHKLTRYQSSLADFLKGTPVVFFVLTPKKKGAVNASHVGELEDFLVQAGLVANPEPLDIQGTKTEEWGIAGVLRGGRGKPSKGAGQFRPLMKL